MERKDQYKPLISVCVPIMNEEDSLESLYDRLVQLSISMKELCDFEFLFSDNNSKDGSWKILTELAAKDERIRAIRFSKNFGFQNSLWANYLHASGDAILQLDADLQDPPELLLKFFEQWQSGYKIVYGIRRGRPDNLFMFWFRRFGYYVLSVLSDHMIPRDVGDFQLIDKSVIKILSKIRFSKPYLRGMIANTGLKSVGIPYDRTLRTSGSSKSFNRPIKVGVIFRFIDYSNECVRGGVLRSYQNAKSILAGGFSKYTYSCSIWNWFEFSFTRDNW